MNALRWTLLALALLVLLVWLAGRFGALRGQPPADLGVREGRLKPPARTPNSVSSQADLYPEHPMREAERTAIDCPAGSYQNSTSSTKRIAGVSN